MCQGQRSKKHFLNIEFFDFSREIKKLLKLFDLQNGVKKTFLHIGVQGQKNILVDIADFEINFLCEALLR